MRGLRTFRKDSGVDKKKRCACRYPKPKVVCTLKCDAVVTGRGIDPDLESMQFDISIKCSTCHKPYPAFDCHFGVIRDVVHKVCASCVLQDGMVCFGEGDNREKCERSPVIGGPAHVKRVGLNA